MSDVILGYHFTGGTLRDGRQIPPSGTWLRHEGPIVPCRSGLHASEHPFDALQYAPGPLLHRVELRGDIAKHGNPTDKHVGRERRILATIDATGLLRRFACDMAMSVLPDDAPQVVRDYLTTADESLRHAAKDAARDAAWGAAWDAAWDAAWYAARDSHRTEFMRRVEAAFKGVQ